MKTPCPSQHVLERFFYSGAPATVSDHVPLCSECQTSLETLAITKKYFLNQYPFKMFLKNRESKKSKWNFLAGWVKNLFLPSIGLRTGIAMASLAGLMLLLVWDHQQPDLSSKGGFGMSLYVSQDQTLEKAPIKAKDRMKLPDYSDLQFVYSTKKAGFFLLVGVEENGTISVYFPKEGVSTSAPLEAAERQPLPIAIRWEPHSSYERFYALWSDTPLQIENVKETIAKSLHDGKKVEALEQLPLPSSQFSILVFRKHEK